MKVLGIIMARGGSKSIPKKNIHPVLGKPLLAYTIEPALASKLMNRVILSTDDREIAEVGRTFGVEVPFMRPAHLAEDATLDLPVIEHALAWLKEHEKYVPDIVVHLRPTSPLRTPEDIDMAIQLLIDHPDADSVRSVCAPAYTPFKMWTFATGDEYLRPLLKKAFSEVFEEFPEPYNMPRQKLPKVWRHTGYLDVIWTSTILEKRSVSGTNIVPFFMDERRSVDVDSMRDIVYAEMLLREMGKT